MTTLSRPTTGPVGVVADDLTGATDLALLASERGLRSVVHVGVPTATTRAPAGTDVVVVALKSRTCPAATAVADSLAALAWLRQQGAVRFHQKYCSTFDSTATGNIGPVLDALLAATGAPWTVVVPAFPALGRTVSGGLLRVHGELLEDSPLREHPLTPMTRSRVADLLSAQSDTPVGEVDLTDLRHDPERAVERALATGARALVIDTELEADLELIARATRDVVLTTGSAGLAAHWPVPVRDDPTVGGDDAVAPLPGPAVSLVGSQSRATREQVAHAATAGQTVLVLDPPASRDQLDGHTADVVARCRRSWSESPSRPVLVQARPTADPSATAAGLLEEAFARIARELAVQGVRRFVVGGGETSGSVVAGLGLPLLRIGPAIDPGVCWSWAGPPGDPFALALKSGNFGAEDFFVRAWDVVS